MTEPYRSLYVVICYRVVRSFFYLHRAVDEIRKYKGAIMFDIGVNYVNADFFFRIQIIST